MGDKSLPLTGTDFYQGPVKIPLSVFLDFDCESLTNTILNKVNVGDPPRSQQDLSNELVGQLINSESSLWNDTGNGCFKNVCQHLFGQGNPDISGIGVVVGYAMEYALAVFLSFVLLYTWHRSGKPEIAESNVKTKALVESLKVFADTAILFALAIVVATVPQSNQRYVRSNQISVYDSLQSTLACTTTIAPCIVAIFALHCCGEKIGVRMTLLGLACLVNIGGVAIPSIQAALHPLPWEFGDSDLNNLAMATLASNGGPYAGLGADAKTFKNGDYFFSICFSKEFQKPSVARAFNAAVYTASFGQIAIFGFIILLALNVLKFRIATTLRRINRIRSNGSWYIPLRSGSGTGGDLSLKRSLQGQRTHRLHVLEIIGFILIPLTMAAMTGAMLLYQRHILHRTWGSANETKWGFGQMVALLMFVPVPIEYFHYWLQNRQSTSPGSNTSEKLDYPPMPPSPEVFSATTDPEKGGSYDLPFTTTIRTAEVRGFDSNDDISYDPGRIAPTPPRMPAQIIRKPVPRSSRR